MYEEYLEVLFKYSLKLLLRRQKKRGASEEQQRASEEQQRASEEQQGASEEQQKASEEQERASEDQQRASEEQQGASEEQQSLTLESDDVNKKDATTLTENDAVDGKSQDTAESETETQRDVVPNPDAEDQADTCQTVKTTVSVTKIDDSDNSLSHVEVASESSDNNEYSFSELHFNFTVFLLWLSVTLINVPCVLVWAHNYR
jgi:membrane protein involved in colicin uptake